MAGKVKTNEVILKSPNGLQEATLSLSDSGVVSSNKTVTLASPTITGAIPQEAWIAPTLLNGWVNFESSYQTARYMKDSMGFVHVQGLIRSGTTSAGTALLTLPIGFRPSQRLIFPVVTSAYSFGSCEVHETGNIIITSGNTSFPYLSLDSITFKAEQ